MMFRTVHCMVAIPTTPHRQTLGAVKRGHQYKYRTLYRGTNVYKESYFPSDIRLWNQLPDVKLFYLF